MKHFYTLLLVIAFCLPTAYMFGQAGMLDTDFNTTGYFSYDFGNNDIIQDVMVQEDQKIVCTGIRLSSGFTSELVVMRLNPDGTLDNSFSDDGIFTFVDGPEAYGVECAQTADGKLIVAGIHYASDYTADFLALRLNADGTLDTTFGTDGFTLVDFDGVDQFTQALTLQDDGSIIISGTSIDTETLDYHNAPTIIRLSPDGVFDTSFGSDGVVQIPTLFIDNELTSIKVQPDGKIIAAGHYQDTFDGTTDFDILLIRTNANGNLDSDFGNNGVVIQPIDAGIDDCFGMDFDADGNIYTAGFTTVAFTLDLNMALLKFLPDGTLDTTFGTDGLVTDSTDPITYANDLVVQSDNKIVLAGGYGSIFSTQDFVLWRYLPTGEPDLSFGTNGSVLSDFTNQTQDINGMALQADGKIIAAGKGDFTGNRDFLVARYTNDIVSGIEESQNLSSLSIYPNPVAQGGQVLLNLSQSLSPSARLRIYDLSGRIIQTSAVSELIGMDESSYALRLTAGISTGTYILEVDVDGTNASQLLRVY
jgi:uncharacterized delta-60 repeat protein